MNPDLTPAASARVADPHLKKALENELLIAGFRIVKSAERADLVLLDKDSDRLSEKCYKIIFVDEEFLKNVRSSKKKVYLPKIFLIEALEAALKKLYNSILQNRILDDEEQTRIEQRAELRTKKYERPRVEISTAQKTQSVFIDGETIRLSDHEWTLFEMLNEASGRGEYVTRSELEAAIGHDGDAGNIVDVYMCRLRRKLEAPFGKKLIYTVRGKGYILKK